MNTLLPAALAFMVCYATLRWLLRSNLARTTLDQPNHRSLHTTPTPRIGGLGVVTGILSSGALLAAMLPGSTPAPSLHLLPLLLLLLTLLAGFCFIDDRRGLSAAVRLPVHLLFALAWVAFVSDALPLGGASIKVGAGETALSSTQAAIQAALEHALAHPLPLIVLTFGLGWMMNLYNFMDGANGLAGGMAVFGFGAYGIAAHLAGQPALAALAFVVAAAALAFLCFNFDPARMFLGDVGSIPLGFLAGALGLWGWQSAAWPLWFPLLVFSPFVVDATVTLATRALRGEKVWQAHRNHAYQRFIRTGWSHRQLALNAYVLMAACAASALALRTAENWLVFACLAIWLVIYALLLHIAAQRSRRHPA